jgi:hypothetical protein
VDGPVLNKKALIDSICKKLAERGMLIEAGWISLKMTSILADASQVQLEEMRNAFFAGAQHLFASIMSILEPGSEPTDADLHRITLINDELDAFVQEYKTKYLKAGGRHE